MRTVMLQQLLESDITGEHSLYKCVEDYHEAHTEIQLQGTIWHAGLWTYIECAVGVTCSCMPPMAHLFKKLHQKAAGSYADHIGSKRTIKLSTYGSSPESRASLTGTSPSKSYVEIS